MCEPWVPVLCNSGIKQMQNSDGQQSEQGDATPGTVCHRAHIYGPSSRCCLYGETEEQYGIGQLT